MSDDREPRMLTQVEGQRLDVRLELGGRDLRVALETVVATDPNPEVVAAATDLQRAIVNMRAVIERAGY